MCVCARMLSRQLIRGGSAPSQKWMLLTRKKTSSRPCAVSGTSDGLKEEQLGSSGRPPSHSSASEAPTDWTGREDREEAAASEASSACLASGALSRHVLCARTEEKNSSGQTDRQAGRQMSVCLSVSQFCINNVKFVLLAFVKAPCSAGGPARAPAVALRARMPCHNQC